MARKPSLIELLGHPAAQSAIQQLAGGMDPRLVAAQAAGDLITREVAKQLGAPVKRSPREPEIIDAEYTIIDVTPRKKK
jgi:hypothetical protein